MKHTSSNVSRGDLLKYVDRDALPDLAYIDREAGVRLLMSILDRRLETLMLAVVAEAGTDNPDDQRQMLRLAKFNALAWVRDIPEAARALLKEEK